MHINLMDTYLISLSYKGLQLSVLMTQSYET